MTSTKRYTGRVADVTCIRGLSDEQIELIPLGCAGLRMSCLPVATSDRSADPWKVVPANVPPEKRANRFANPYQVPSIEA